jgi:hypothetical protein
MILLFHVDNYTSGSMVDAGQMAKSHMPLQTEQNTCSCMFVPDTPGTLAVGDVRGFTYQKHWTFPACCVTLYMIVEPGPVSRVMWENKQNKTPIELYFVSLIKVVEEMPTILQSSTTI